ncbi:MAG: hypothetical protein M3Y81_15150 [Chloroflexota bacterium]|nr:hypothetical protein [Chloroflexota bacterium]
MFLLHLLVIADIGTSLSNLAGILQAFIGGATVLAVTVAGYLWMTSEHNPARRSRAESALWAAAIGALLVVLAPSIQLLLSSAIG